MAVPSPPTKADLRAAALARRRDFARALPPDVRGAFERQLMTQVLPHLDTATIIAGYHPMRDEIDPLPILEGLVATGRIVAFPWFGARDARMIFRAGAATEPGPWGVLQPPADAPAAAPEIVLVPLVAADARCNRIGHGKGHYDRALAHLREAGPVCTIGLAWDTQIVDQPIPADPWDIPLDAVATPSRFIERPTP